MGHEDSLILEVARLYHERNLSQEKIAQRLDLDQPLVSQILREAVKRGIVRKIVQAPLATDLAEEIKRKHSHIVECIVIAYKGDEREESNTIVTDELGKKAADHFKRHVTSESLVGVSCGTTLGSMVDHLEEPYNTRGLQVYSLSIWCRAHTYAISPVALVSNIIRKCPGSIGFSAQLPGYSLNIAQATKEKEVDMRRVKYILEAVLLHFS
jgi:DNA-binding transcriptional regulator LsrR (DeoR family)